MHGVVYVDILVLVNAIIAYFLLKCTAFFASRVQKTWRLCAAAFVAGLSALTLLLPPLGFLPAFGIKAACAVLVVLVAFEPGGWRCFGKSIFWYISLNTVLGGIVTAAVFYGVGTVAYQNFSLYIHLSPILLIACILGMYAAVQLCSLLFGKPKPQQTVAFTLQIQQHKVQGMALLDTGMNLKDALSGKQAMMVSFPATQQKLPMAIVEALLHYFAQGALQCDCIPLRLIAVKTATGMRALPAFCGDTLVLHTAPHAKEVTCPLLVFTNESLADGSYQAVLSPDYI